MVRYHAVRVPDEYLYSTHIVSARPLSSIVGWAASGMRLASCLVDELERHSLGAVIRVLREAHGFSRNELARLTAENPADRVGVDMLAKIEQGARAPSGPTLKKLACALGLDALDISNYTATWVERSLAGDSRVILRAAVKTSLARRRAGRYSVLAAPVDDEVSAPAAEEIEWWMQQLKPIVAALVAANSQKILRQFISVSMKS